MGEGGVLAHIPVGWTSIAVEDPFVEVAAGRSAFRVEDLLALADMLERGVVKEIMPNV